MTAPVPIEPFRCEVRVEQDRIRVVPIGDLDIATVPTTKERLREARETGHGRVVLDLREVSFMDSTGLRMILATATLARDDGFAFSVIRGGPELQRLFELVGVLDRIPFEPPPGS